MRQINQHTKAKRDENRSFCFDDATERIYSPEEAVKFGLCTGAALDRGDRAVISFAGTNGAQPCAMAIASGLCAKGIECFVSEQGEEYFSGFCAEALCARLYIHVSAGTGIKISAAGRSGSPLDKQLLKNITKNFLRSDHMILSSKRQAAVNDCDDLLRLYKARLAKRERLNGVRVRIKTSSRLTAELFDSVIRGRNDINGEEIVFNFSYDCKKVSAYSEKTGSVFYETLLLAAVYIAVNEGTTVVLPYSFPRAAELLHGDGKTVRLPFGESITINDDNRFLTDSFILCMTIIDYISKNRMSLYDLLESVPSAYVFERYVYTGFGAENRLLNLIANRVLSENAERSSAGGRVTARALKRGEGIMLISEAASAETASSLCDEVEEYVKRASANTCKDI